MGQQQRPQPTDVNVVMRSIPGAPNVLPSNIGVQDPAAIMSQAPTVSDGQSLFEDLDPVDPSQFEDLPETERSPNALEEFFKQQPIHPLQIGQAVTAASEWLNEAVKAVTIRSELPPMPKAVTQLLQGQGKVGEDMLKEFKTGNYLGGLERMAYWLAPVIGQQFNEMANMRDQGEPLRAFGGAVGAASALAPLKSPLPTPEAQFGATLKLPRPSTARAAAQYADANQIPLTIGERTGSEPIKIAESGIEKTSFAGDALVNQPQRALQAERMASTGRAEAAKLSPMEETAATAGIAAKDAAAGVSEKVGSAYAKTAEKIAGKVSAQSQTPSSAAQSVRTTLKEKADSLKQAADEAYSRLREIESDPVHAREVVTGTQQSNLQQSTSFGGGFLKVPVTETVPLPVDLRALGVKDALRPIVTEMEATWPLARQEASPGYTALKQLVTGADAVPLSRADRMLSAIKSIAREQGGLAKLAVAKLDAAVRRVAQEAGPEAAAALQAGREATKAKVKVQELLAAIYGKKGATENATAFGKIIGKEDKTTQMLRRVLAEDDTVKPLVSRAVLDQVFDDLLLEGQTLTPQGVNAAARRWAQLGDDTKALLFDKATARQLDDYFRQASRQASNPSVPRLTGGAVDTFEALVSPRDRNIEDLRALAKADPAVPKKIGRAWLEAQLDLSTEEAGKFAHGQKLLANYQRLGPETKRLLFGENTRNLDNFFRLAADVNFPGNTSRTAYTTVQLGKLTLALTNPLTGAPYIIGQDLAVGALSKLMWNPAAASAVVKAMKTPKAAKVASLSVAAKVLNFARAEGIVSKEALTTPKAAESEQQNNGTPTAQAVTPPPPGITRVGPFEVQQR